MDLEGAKMAPRETPIEYGSIAPFITYIVTGGVILDLSTPTNGSLWRAKMEKTGQKGT